MIAGVAKYVPKSKLLFFPLYRVINPIVGVYIHIRIPY